MIEHILRGALGNIMGRSIVDRDPPGFIVDQLKRASGTIEDVSEIVEEVDPSDPLSFIHTIGPLADTLESYKQTEVFEEKGLLDKILTAYGYKPVFCHMRSPAPFQDTDITKRLDKYDDSDYHFKHANIGGDLLLAHHIPTPEGSYVAYQKGENSRWYTPEGIDRSPTQDLFAEMWRCSDDVLRLDQLHIESLAKADQEAYLKPEENSWIYVYPISIDDPPTYIGESKTYLDQWETLMERKEECHVVLLHGPPGTGKTTLGWEALVSLGDQPMIITHDSLQAYTLRVITEVPCPDTVLINDIDRMNKNSRRELVMSLEEKPHADLLVMTANDLEKLPAAARRPGRIDQIIQIDHTDTDPDELAALFIERHGLDLTSKQVDTFKDMIEHSGAHAEELALRLDALDNDAILENDKTFDREWLNAHTNRQLDDRQSGEGNTG